MSEEAKEIVAVERGGDTFRAAYFGDEGDFTEVCDDTFAGVMHRLLDESPHDPRPNEGKKEGVCCLHCYSVIFNVGKLLRHTENRNHYWYKSGDDLVLNAKTLTQSESDPFQE